MGRRGGRGGEEDQRPGKMRRIFRGWRNTCQQAARPPRCHRLLLPQGSHPDACLFFPPRPKPGFGCPSSRIAIPFCCALLPVSCSSLHTAASSQSRGPANSAAGCDSALCGSHSPISVRMKHSHATPAGHRHVLPGVLVCPTVFSCDAPVVRNILSDELRPTTDPFLATSAFAYHAPRARGARPVREEGCRPLTSSAGRRRREPMRTWP